MKFKTGTIEKSVRLQFHFNLHAIKKYYAFGRLASCMACTIG
jgi:hypothetical protein